MINTLFKNCVHIGHKKNLLNNEMKNFVIKSKYKISIINLHKTLDYLNKTLYIFKKFINSGKICLFLCTKKKFRKLIELFCSYFNMPFMIRRWYSGILTNFNSIKQSINNFNYINSILNNKNIKIKKKSLNKIKKEIAIKRKYIIGIKNLTRPPDLIFIINPKKHKSAINEANKVKVPIISLVDTNNSIKNINYILPWNDDSIRSVTYFFKILHDYLTTKNI